MARSALTNLVIMRFQGRTPAGIEAEMTLHATGAAANSAANMLALSAVGAAWMAKAGTRALFSNGVPLDQCVVQDLGPARLASQQTPVAVAGTRGAGAPVAAVDSLVVTKLTAQAGVAFRGRFYTWGALATDLDAAGGLWDSAFATAWGVAIADLLDDIPLTAPTAYTPVIWHRVAGEGGVPAADTTTAVTGALGRTELAVVRSRRD